MEFHFNLLKNHDSWYFYCTLRAKFNLHGKPGSDFILERIKNERDIELLSDAIQILVFYDHRYREQIDEGIFKQGLKMIYELLNHDSPKIRYRAVLYLGPWCL